MIKYHDLDQGQRTVVRQLRRNRNAYIFFPDDKAWLEVALDYLRQHGYKPNPQRNETTQYFTHRYIDTVNSSSLITQRIMAKHKKW